MSEQFGGLDAGSQINTDGSSEITQEQVEAIQESAKKAAQASATKQQQSKRDAQNAKLLSLLLKHIDDDLLLQHISLQLVEHKIRPHLIVMQFLPLLKLHISIDLLKPLYKDIWIEQERCLCRSPQDIVTRYKVLFKMYNDLQDLNSEYKKSLIGARCTHFEFSQTEQNGQQISTQEYINNQFK